MKETRLLLEKIKNNKKSYSRSACFLLCGLHLSRRIYTKRRRNEKEVCAWRSIIEPLSLSPSSFTVRASSPKLLGACYEKHTETNEKRERERETRRNRKSRDRAPADFSLLRLVVGCGPLSPLFVSDITQQQLTNFLIILTEACKTTKVGLVETF